MYAFSAKQTCGTVILTACYRFSLFCTVVEAGNGQQAIDLMVSGLKPNIIVTDQMMPILDGYGLLAAVRARAEFKSIPVILVTAQAVWSVFLYFISNAQQPVYAYRERKLD